MKSTKISISTSTERKASSLKLVFQRLILVIKAKVLLYAVKVKAEPRSVNRRPNMPTCTHKHHMHIHADTQNPKAGRQTCKAAV